MRPRFIGIGDEEALCHELDARNSHQKRELLRYLRGLNFVRQESVAISFKGIKRGTDLRLGLLVEDKVIVD